MLLAGFIVQRHVLLYMLQNRIVGNRYFFTLDAINQQLEYIEQFTGIAPERRSKASFSFIVMFFVWSTTSSFLALSNRVIRSNSSNDCKI